MRKKFYLSIFAMMLFLLPAHAQTSYDFRDGTIGTNKQSADGSLKLSGTYGYNGTNYGIDLKAGSIIKIAVTGSSTLKFLGSKYSSLSLHGVSKAGIDLGTQATKVTIDVTDTYDFVYNGVADTLVFTSVLTGGAGSDIYLPLITVTPAQPGSDVALISPVKNIIYYFDLRNGSIIPTTTTGNIAITTGLFGLTVGSSNTYGYNGTTHGSILKPGNQITLQVAGNSYIKIGGCQYSAGNISVSSTTGIFDVTSKAASSPCYPASTVDFLYVGTPGTVTLSFSGTTYIPYISIVPTPYAVELTPWVKKTGQVVLNGVAINLTAGDNATANPTVTVGAGTVVSATPSIASIRINMGGKTLNDVVTSFSGNIAGVSVNGDTLKITFTDPTTKPTGYKILVADNSQVISAQAGQTYSYNFTDGSVMPQTGYTSLRYNTFISGDGILTLNSNTSTPAQQFGYHDSAHGSVFFPGNSMKFIVAGDATITFGTCQYGGATDGVFEFTDATGTVLGTTPSQDKGTNVCGTHSFSYTGAAGVITATLKSTISPLAEFYIHGVAIENAAKIIKTVKTDVWDFGAAQLDASLYNNQLTETIINGWYPGITAGTSGKPLPGGFTVGVLSWVGGTNSDRIRTSNTNLTRYDANSCPTTVGTETLTGNLYVNGAATSARYLGLTLSADDEVTLYAKAGNGSGKLNFVYVQNPVTQTDVVATNSTVSIVKFVAKNSGAYHIYDSADKPFYFRILRKDATMATLNGTFNLTDAPGIPDGYSLVLTNTAGKSWSQVITGSVYSIQIPAGYTYNLTLANASGYIITNGAQVTINADATHEIAVKKVEMYTVSGSITGLSAALLAKLTLKYTPTVSKIYVPEPIINVSAGTYSVMLEPNCTYTIAATGVNDFYIPAVTISITGETAADIAFEPKPVYAITINPNGLSDIQKAKLNVTFTNLTETGYVYSFTGISGITLRDGVYKITTSGLDEYPLQLGATSNLKVNGSDTSKSLAFAPVTDWSFDDITIVSGTTINYKGMVFSGAVSNEIAKGHMIMSGTGTAKVPMNPGQKAIITYYYTANFSIENGTAIITTSNSTSVFETVEFTYTGIDPGFITLKNNTGSTYITDIAVATTLPYSGIITVGPDKSYLTINGALSAARAMARTAGQRIKIMIDPGNYEEMLMIDVPDISLVNAATIPSIDLLNKGVDIAVGAVRITSYYGHGYNYYSMGTDQKWNPEALRVNKENGYTSYANTGSGTTNGSYWNATVVVTAPGLEVDNIILENSYNQYISAKESNDVVVEWTSGGKGTRPATIGNTSVQNKSFVERAAAIAFTKSADKTILYKCRVVGRQDSFYGAEGARVVTYKGSIMGGTDYIFGGMTLVSYQSELAMNTSDVSTDVSYLTAAQQTTARGFLMYECLVTSAKPGIETASTSLSKPGELGRPWQATTSEVVFYNTTIEVSNATGFEGKSMIAPEGWLNSLGGASDKCFEYGTIEKSGENNATSRASWSHILTTPTLIDGTVISTLNFTKGTDGWDPIPGLIAIDTDVATGVTEPQSTSIQVSTIGNKVLVSNVKSNTRIDIYDLDGALLLTRKTNADVSLPINKGLWVVKVNSEEGNKVVKVLIH